MMALVSRIAVPTETGGNSIKTPVFSTTPRLRRKNSRVNGVVP